jgi:hypothetical protein
MKYMETTCPSCDDVYSKIGLHWTKSDCYVEPSQRKKEIMRGLLLGDGTIVTTGKTPSLHIPNINREFLSWVDEELGVFSNGVKFRASGEQLARYNDSDGETNDQYIVRTPSSEWLENLSDWYSTGEKEFPDNPVSPLTASVWYCCDGNLNNNKGSYRAKIYADNERGNDEKLISIFSECPVEPNISGGTIYFSVSDTDKFLQWMDGPIQGFEYKWETETFK